MSRSESVHKIVKVFSALVVVTALLLAAGKGNASDQNYSEYSVKAALVLNFLKFTKFPDASIQERDIHVCVAASESVLAAFSILNNNVVQQHKIVVVPYTSDVTPSCDVLFVHKDWNEQGPLLRKTKGLNILTIGDHAQFLVSGGMIGLVIDDNSVVFTVNAKRAKEEEILFSSKMLLLAKEVY